MDNVWLAFFSDFMQKFLEAVLPVLFTAITGLVIAWITKVVNQIKSNINDDAEWVIQQAVTAAVLAAEQQGLVNDVMDKKSYAVDVATEWLAQKGIKIDLDRLSVLIEAAVMQEFNRGKVTE
jgi:uncharacterized membrane protein